jgi:uncharacterized protein DUF5818
MLKRFTILAIAITFVAAIVIAADKAKDGSWTGWITDSKCAAKGQYDAKHTGCADSCVKRGEKYVLYDPEAKKSYVLDPQDKATGHAGHQVKVTGSMDGDTIKVKSLEDAEEHSGHSK